MRLKEICELVDKTAPFSISGAYCREYGGYDNSGILVDCGREITGVLFSLDLSRAAAEEAKKRGAQLIVTHHPAIYSPIRSLAQEGEGALVLACVQAGISVISAHLNLDMAEGGIDEYEGELIRSAIEFDDLTVEDVLTPRVDVAAVRKGQDMDSVLDVFRKTGYSRLPVYKDTIDNVIGLLNEKDFYKAYLAGAKKIDGAVSDNLIYAAPTMKISALLRKLQQEKTHLAIVVDEFGGTLGIVTLEDILEELVGDIWDEHDRVVQSFTALGDGSVEVSGDVKLDEFFDYFGIEADADEYDVVQLSGVVFQELGRVPQKGDRLEFYGYEIEVSEVAQKRAVKCVVRKAAKADEPTDEGKDKQDKDKQEI